jgi:hypothetical protein
MRTAVLTPAAVPLRHYELDLVRWQLERLGYPGDVAVDGGWTVELNGQPAKAVVDDLVKVAFVDRVQLDGTSSESLFAVLESDGSVERQRSRSAAHRYLVHGIHYYRGKYYPQIARSLIVGSRAAPDDVILDPFMGSGTTLIEAALLGYEGVGVDLSPMATFLSQAKATLLCTPVAEYEADVKRCIASLRRHASSCTAQHGHLRLDGYLASWFDTDAAGRVDCALHVVAGVRAPAARDLLRLCLSRRVRAWSMQEPEDMRVRRREEAPDTTGALDDLASAVEDDLSRVARGQQLLQGRSLKAPRAVLGDGRLNNWRVVAGLAPRSVGAVVTSPPYATALPYIDTDRLSILTLGLARDDEWRSIEGALVGSREISNADRRDYESLLRRAELPGDVTSFLRALSAAVTAAGDSVGFRRRNMPALLTRYFTGMSACIRTWVDLCKPGAMVALVVGDSRTCIDGRWWEIPTRALLSSILESHGFAKQGEHVLTDQPAYTRHSANAIKAESILLHEAS